MYKNINIIRLMMIIGFSMFLILSKTGFSASGLKDNYTVELENDFDITGAYLVHFMHLAMIDENRNSPFYFYPNTRGILNVGARYKFFRFSYSFNLKDNKIYDEYYGPTKFRSFDFGIKTRPFWLNFYYYNYTGFYISEENILFPKFNTDSVYAQNNDLSTFKFGISSNIIINRDFSMKAAFEYSEIQKRSAGSLFVFITYEWSNINAGDEPIIPDIYRADYKDLADMDNRVTFFSWGTGMGYAYSLVLGPVNFSNALVAGPDLQIYYYKRPRLRVPYSLHFKSSLSLNVRNFFTGAKLSLDVNNHYFNEDRIRRQQLAFTFRAGLRF